jgi:hypothetical protein
MAGVLTLNLWYYISFKFYVSNPRKSASLKRWFIPLCSTFVLLLFLVGGAYYCSPDYNQALDHAQQKVTKNSAAIWCEDAIGIKLFPWQTIDAGKCMIKDPHFHAGIFWSNFNQIRWLDDSDFTLRCFRFRIQYRIQLRRYSYRNSIQFHKVESNHASM